MVLIEKRAQQQKCGSGGPSFYWEKSDVFRFDMLKCCYFRGKGVHYENDASKGPQQQLLLRSNNIQRCSGGTGGVGKARFQQSNHDTLGDRRKDTQNINVVGKM